MRNLLFLLLLAGCQTANLQPTAINPTVTCLNNSLMAIAAASAGDCSVPICVPVAGACGNLPTTTTTIQDSQTALQNCVVSEVLGVKAAAFFNSQKAQFCTVPTSPIIPKTAPIPPKTEWTPPGWGCDTEGSDTVCCGYIGCVHPVWDARLPT